MSEPLRFLSLFSGMGGFDLALEMAGMECVGQVEIDRDANKVLSKHWPDVRRWDDVRDMGVGCGTIGSEEGNYKLDEGGDSSADWGAPNVDLVCGGFPCQDVSVAGQRAGLDGDRSGLWFEFQRILFELRPRWAIIENVPGLLSSNQGRDFALILDGLGECGFGSIAWAVLDSQHFGVAQRRRRVFIVCGPTERSAEKVLSLCESCGGHPQKSRAARQGAAAGVGVGVANPLGAKRDGGWRGDLDNDPYIAGPLKARDWKGLGFEAENQIVAIRTAQTSANGHGIAEDVAHTLDGANGQAIAHTLRAEGFDASEDGTGRGTPLVAFGIADDETAEAEMMPTMGTPSASGGGHPAAVAQGASVRRLTPTECLRLQAFPDDWFDGLGLSDGAKYKLCGNAVTVSTVNWIAQRIVAMEAQR